MNEFQATTIFIALFALRCIVPLLLTVAIGYAMNRLVDRWETEEKAQGAAPCAPQRAVQRRVTAQPAATPLALPCWVLRNCDARRQSCPAYQQSGLACWQARTNSEGALPAACATCSLYTGAPIAAA